MRAYRGAYGHTQARQMLKHHAFVTKPAQKPISMCDRVARRNLLRGEIGAREMIYMRVEGAPHRVPSHKSL